MLTLTIKVEQMYRGVTYDSHYKARCHSQWNERLRHVIHLLMEAVTS